jgi:hypothetical protein
MFSDIQSVLTSFVVIILKKKKKTFHFILTHLPSQAQSY